MCEMLPMTESNNAGVSIPLLICDWRMLQGSFQRATAFDINPVRGAREDEPVIFGSRLEDGIEAGAKEHADMRAIECLLSQAIPRSIGEARLLVRVAFEILMWRRHMEPRRTRAQDPALELMRNSLALLHSVDVNVKSLEKNDAVIDKIERVRPDRQNGNSSGERQGSIAGPRHGEDRRGRSRVQPRRVRSGPSHVIPRGAGRGSKVT